MTLVIEAVGAATVISPLWPRVTRLVAVLLMPALHLGFALCLDLGPFSYAMMSFFPLLVHRTHWDALSAWAARHRPARVAWFDAGCGICFWTARVLARLDRAGRIDIRPNDAAALPPGLDPALADTTILVRDEQGRVLTRSHAIAELVRALPFGTLPWIVLRTPGLRWIWDRLYDAVASNRTRVSGAFGLAACGIAPAPAAAAWEEPVTPVRLWRARVARVLSEAACAVLFVALYAELVHANAAVPRALHFQRPQFLHAIVDYPRLYQGWRMFAPDAPPEDFNVSVEAYTIDGRLVDPYNEVASRHKRAPATSIPPQLAQDQFFTSYSLFIHRPNYRPYWGAFEQWILRYHERTKNRKDRIVRFTAYKLSDKSPPMGETEPTRFRKEPFLIYPKK
jgi:predicted DCC family thiol-disulfide oxidoreductase YuxK